MILCVILIERTNIYSSIVAIGAIAKTELNKVPMWLQSISKKITNEDKKLRVKTLIESLDVSQSESIDGVSTTNDDPGGIVIEGDCEIAGRVEMLGWSSAGTLVGTSIALPSTDVRV